VTPDSELVAGAQRGQRAAFAALVERYQRSVLAVALAELGDLHAAEDVAQATLVTALGAIRTLRNGAKFGPWLMQIARRQVIDAVRARRVTVSIPADLATAGPSAAGQLDRWADHEELLNHLTRLSDRDRTLIGLRYFDGLTTSEISQVTGRPLGSVTKQLSRALARLRAWYQEPTS
jgi:RNA polymerase sigma-70 factor (ECF subfamily)